MKQLLTYIFVVLTASVFAQAPQSIPYQAVVRNSDGSVMASTAITITFKIHDNTATGTVVYEENHTATTNAQGLISLNVGNGSVVSGTFSGINWGTGIKFLHVLMNAGSGVVDLGTQQMMSVPYALYAEEVNVRVSVTGDSLFIGDQVSIVPGVSAANPVSISNYGSVLLPGNTTCQNEYISVTGCGGQDSLLYYDRYYSLTEIGGQCWFAENLATDKYSNGDDLVMGPVDMFIDSIGTFNYYENVLLNDSIYGKLYNWFAATDDRGICPTGWHVPTDCDWMYLEKIIGIPFSDIEIFGERGSTQASALRSNLYWPTLNASSVLSTGFNALPSGYFDPTSPGLSYYHGLNWSTSFLTSSLLSGNQDLECIARSIYDNNGFHNPLAISRGVMMIFDGGSIRCIKD